MAADSIDLLIMLLRRSGPVRQLLKDEEIRAVARYLVANPLGAGIVENIGGYPLWDTVFL